MHSKCLSSFHHTNSARKSAMKVIPSDHKKARLWVEACSASLAIDKAESAAMFANMCGFKTWEAIIKVIGAQAPSSLDESLTSEQLADRRAGYIEVLVEMFGMNPHYASHLVTNLSPSSEKLPRKIAIDSASMHDPLKDSQTPLFPPGMESMLEEGMEAFVEMMKQSHPELANVDMTNFAERMRISKPVNPGLYFDFCQNHGWAVIEESYEEEYVFGEPSFSIDSSFGPIPVYANSIVQMPYDTDDEMAEHVREVVLEDASDLDDDPTVILFWGLPLSREVRGVYFTCPGSLYHDGEWHDILLNAEMTSVEDMIKKVVAGIDYNNPDKIFEDKHNQSLKTFLALQVGATNSHELSKFEIMSIGGASGWSSPLIGNKK